MSISVDEYYEHAGFWTDEAFGAPDRERIARTVQLVPMDIESLLDVGCGNGLFCNALAERRPTLRVTGVDQSEAALSKVRTDKRRCSATELPFANRAFDCVSALQVLEHLPRDAYAAALREISRVAAKWVIVSVPFQERLERNATRCPECQTIFNVDLHLRSFSREDVVELLAESGLECEHVETLGILERFVGQDTYRRLAYPGKQYIWRSPICPLCGYRSQPANRASSPPPPSWRTRLLRGLRAAPKSLWPKERAPYWIVARYRRVA